LNYWPVTLKPLNKTGWQA